MFLSYKIKSIGESRAANILGLWYFTLVGSRDLLLFRRRALYSASFDPRLQLLLANQAALSAPNFSSTARVAGKIDQIDLLYREGIYSEEFLRIK